MNDPLTRTTVRGLTVGVVGGPGGGGQRGKIGTTVIEETRIKKKKWTFS